MLNEPIIIRYTPNSRIEKKAYVYEIRISISLKAEGEFYHIDIEDRDIPQSLLDLIKNNINSRVINFATMKSNERI